MKLLICLLSILMLNKDCNQNKSIETTSNSINAENPSEMNQEYTKIWYEAKTRGFYEKIWITKDSITISTDRNNMSSSAYAILDSEWSSVTKLLNDVNIEEMPNLDAPTSKRHYDGAAFATLAVSKNKEETISNNFDHGHPPSAIKEVVNKVLSLKEKYHKK